MPADFNRDGSADLAVPERDGAQSLIYFNDGHGGFARTKPFGPPTAAARTAAAADLNGDDWLDLVVGDERLGTFVYLNDGTGGLLPGFQLVAKTLVPYAIAIRDMNRDGRTDIVIGYETAPGSVFFNDGSGRAVCAGPLWRWAGYGVWTRAWRSQRRRLSGHCRRQK